MTYEEAIERINHRNNGFGKLDEAALNIGIEAIKKQIPKKPIVRNYANFSACSCGMKIYPLFSFCPYCSQAIDWSN